jgi:hypothetical protein
MRVGNRHRRIVILGVGFERLAGDLAAQILETRMRSMLASANP